MKLPYFKIKEAFSEAKDSFSYGSGSEKLSSTAKLLGKSIANVGMLAVEIGADVLQKAPEHIGKTAGRNLEKNSHTMTSEQIENAHKLIEMGEKARETRLQKEKEEREKRFNNS